MARGTDRRQVLEEEITAAVCAAITIGFSGPFNKSGLLDGIEHCAPETQTGKKAAYFRRESSRTYHQVWGVADECSVKMCDRKSLW